MTYNKKVKFYNLSVEERLDYLVQNNIISDNNKALILNAVSKQHVENADSFIENTIGCFPVSMGVVLDCLIDKEYINIPLVVEETSIVAGLNKTAKLFRQHQGVITNQIGTGVIGQMFLGYIANDNPYDLINNSKKELLELLNTSVFKSMYQRGGGAKNIELRCLKNKKFVLHLLCDTCDAMGANLINMALEKIKPLVEKILDIDVGACILSNFNDTRVIKAQVEIENLDYTLMQKIADLSEYAQVDHYRAATHNKGVMNAIDGVLISTGNDWRAVEAGVHSYAAKDGFYKGITTWHVKGNKLIGVFEAPIDVGIVGGVTKNHQFAKFSIELMNIKSASKLARVLGAVGLMQNYAALNALAGEGIVSGHMKLHINNLLLNFHISKDKKLLLKKKMEDFLLENKSITLNDAKKIFKSMG